MTGRDFAIRSPGINPQIIRIPSACSIRAGGIFWPSSHLKNFFGIRPSWFSNETLSVTISTCCILLSVEAMKRQTNLMKQIILSCLMVTSAHAVRILTEAERFVHTPVPVGTSTSQVNGAIRLPRPEPFAGVQNSFLLFGTARDNLRLPVFGTANFGRVRTGGYLAVVNKRNGLDGTVQWSTGVNDGGLADEKIATIQGVNQVPENSDTDDSIATVTSASFINEESLWICGDLEDRSADGRIFEVKVGGIGQNGAGELRLPWDRQGKTGYLMKWDLTSFRPTLIAPLEGPASPARYEPAAVASLDDESVLVMCSDLDKNWSVRKYDAAGQFVWSWSFPNAGTRGIQLMEGKGSEDKNFFVLAEVVNPDIGGLGGRDLIIYCIRPNSADTGADLVRPWNGTVLGGNADDFGGAICPHADGSLSVAFTLGSDRARFPRLEEEEYGDLSKEHCIVANLKRNEAGNQISANWARAVGKAIANPDIADWAMRAQRLACDPVGNLHLGIIGNGLYEIECVDRRLAGNGGLISIDGTGRVWDFKNLRNFSMLGGVVGIGVEEQIALGDDGIGITMAVFRPEAVQTSYLVRALNPVDEETAMKDLVRAITGLGGQVHLEMRHERFGIFSAAAFLTDEQVIAIEGDESLTIDPDPQIITQNSGAPEIQESAGWALRRINEHGDTSAGPGSSYHFWMDDAVEANERPWVFLLDTGLPAGRINDLSGSRFAPQIPFDPSHPVEMDWVEETLEAPIGANAEDGEYVVNLDSDHAEKVTALMAFQPFGSGQGIPFQLENINIYPDRGTGLITTYPSYIADGIFLAVDKVLDEREAPTGPQTGVLIVIPSSGLSSVALTEFDTLELALDEALDANIPVILSAGNTAGAPVEMTVPAGYGNRAGIITMGATKIVEGGVLNSRVVEQSSDSSGINETITLYAPGVAVPIGNNGETFGGTSASCALAAGVAAAILSRNPDVTPEVLENAMIANSVFQTSDEINLLTLDTSIPQGCGFDDWLTIHGLSGEGFQDDGDGDGVGNLVEFLTGTDPVNGDSSVPLQIDMTRVGTSWELELELPTWILPEQTPFERLQLGCGLQVDVTLMWSDDLETWAPVPIPTGGHWTTGDADLTRRVTPLLFTVPSSTLEEKRFWRLELQSVE